MIPYLAFPLLWSALAHAIPTSSQQQHAELPDLQRRSTSTLKVSARSNPDFVLDGPAALAAAYERWDMPVPESLANHNMLTRREGYECKLRPLPPLPLSVDLGTANPNV